MANARAGDWLVTNEPVAEKSGGFAVRGLIDAADEVLAEAVEFFVVLEVNDELATAAGVGAELDFEAEGVADLLLQGGELVVLGSRLAGGAGENVGRGIVFLADTLANDALDIANAETVLLDPLRECELLVLVTEREERAGVAGGDQAFAEGGENFRRELQEAHQVGDRGTVDFQTSGEIVLRAMMLVEVALEGEGFFDRVQVFALEVFDDGELGDEAIVGLAESSGDRWPTRKPGGAEAAFAGNELIPTRDLADEDRLEHVMLFETLGERGDFDIAELAAGLEGVFLDLVDRELEEGGGGDVRGSASSRALAGAAG